MAAASRSGHDAARRHRHHETTDYETPARHRVFKRPPLCERFQLITSSHDEPRALWRSWPEAATLGQLALYENWVQMTDFFALPGWIYWWLSSCVEPAAMDATVWPPAGVVSAVPVIFWLVPLLFLGSASGAIGFALMSWARGRQRKVTYFALGAGAVMIGVFTAQLYQVVSNIHVSFDTPVMSQQYFMFAGDSITNAAICGVFLGVSALMLRFVQSRLWQGIMQCLAFLPCVFLTAAWGAFAYAATCGL